jgi:hypothetical protein
MSKAQTTDVESYTMIYGESDTCVPGKITLDVDTDDAADAAVRKYVASSFRNSSWGVVELRCGRVARYSNVHGDAVGGIAEA